MELPYGPQRLWAKAIAEEILIDAGDATRSEALKVWRQLGTNPQKFVPLTKAVLALIQMASRLLCRMGDQAINLNSWAFSWALKPLP